MILVSEWWYNGIQVGVSAVFSVQCFDIVILVTRRTSGL